VVVLKLLMMQQLGMPGLSTTGPWATGETRSLVDADSCGGADVAQPVHNTWCGLGWHVLCCAAECCGRLAAYITAVSASISCNFSGQIFSGFMAAVLQHGLQLCSFL
jgi:hypothetical protein